MNIELLNKANELITLANENKSTIKAKEEYFRLCLKAGICPTCGSELKIELEVHTYVTGLWPFKKTHKSCDNRVVCPEQHKIIDFYGNDRGYPSYCEFNDCINNDISIANLKQRSNPLDEYDD